MRLFVALELPWPLRERLAGLATGIMGARWVPRENMHLTLRFVGEVPNWRAEEIDLALHGIRGTRLSVGHLGCWVVRESWPRDGALGRRGAVIRARASAGEDRDGAAARRAGARAAPFHPHVTLARLDQPANDKITGFVQRNNLFRAEAFSVERFTLFSSQLGKESRSIPPKTTIPLAERGKRRTG